MMRWNKLLAGIACLTVVAACGGSGADSTTTTTASVAPSTTAQSQTTSTTAPSVTSTVAETTPPTTATSGASGDLALVQSAMATSADSAPARIEGVMQMAGVDAGTGEPVDVEMPFSVTTDAATGNTAMIMDLGAMAAAMGDTEGMPAEMAEMMGSMEVRQVGDVVYLKFPFFTAFLGADTEWVSMPAEEGADLTGGMGSGANPSDPTSFLDSFSDAEGTAEEIGPEEIRGISTTRYRVVVDESWRESLSAEELAELEAQGPLPTTSFPLDLWIDDDGLVHRMAMEVDGAEMTGAEAGEEFESMTMTFDFYDFGQPVEIEAPPSDQVSDISDLAGPLGTMVP